MNIQQFEYVLAVSKLHHFGLASEACFVTQSTLSTMIGKFEGEIGITIFNRDKRPVTVTHDGQKVIERIQATLKEVETLKEEIKLMKGELSGDLRIGAIPTVSPYIFPKFLWGFTQRYPKIHFSISELTTDSIIKQLHNGQLDIGVLAIPLHNNKMREHALYDEEFVLFDQSGKVPSPSKVDLEHVDYSKFWLMEEGHCFGQQMIKICDMKERMRFSTTNFEFKAGSIDSLVQFVKENNGITLLPYLATLDMSTADQKSIFFFEDKVPLRTIGLMTNKYFVKKKILDLLKIEIQNSIVPLLRTCPNKKYVVPPR